MLAPVVQLRQGYRLLQIGLTLFLFTSFEGFAIPYLGAPRLGLPVHSSSALLGVMLLVIGLLWPRLTLTAAESRMAFWFLVYSSLALVTTFQLGALLGAGSSTMALAGTSHPTALQTIAIKFVAYSTAPTGVASLGLILWGLRPSPALH
jgi:(hydroxyamino)benzene mutase